MFFLSGDPDESLRLKSYSSTSTSTGKCTVRIVLETEDAYALAHALQRLGEVKAGQKARPSRPKRLMLPAPEQSE